MKGSYLIILFLILAIPFETSVVYNDIVNLALILIIVTAFFNIQYVYNLYKVKLFRIVCFFLIGTIAISFVDLLIYNYDTKLLSYLGFILLFISSSIIFYNSKDTDSFIKGYIIGIKQWDS